MPSPSFSVSTEISAAPQVIFDYLSDLSGHGEWAANELRVEPVDATPRGVGKKYRSYAQARGREFHAALVVTEYSAPKAFAFSGKDETGNFSHRFTLDPSGDRTRVTRTAQFDLSLSQYVFYLAALNRVRLPAAREALDRLKQHLERSAP